MLKRSLFFFFLLAGTLLSQPDSLLLKGNRLAYNLEFDKAEKLFNQALAKTPNSPAPYYFIARNYLWKLLGSRRKENEIIFKKFVAEALKAGDSLIEKGVEDEWVYYYLGSSYLLKSAEASFNGENFQAFLNTKKSVSYFKKALEINPHFNDAYLGLGIFNYALSFVPGIFKIALNLSGLSYDKEKAIGYLKKAYDNSVFSKEEAAFHLSKIYFEYVADYDSASFYIENLLREYPNNILFKYQRALIQIEKRNLPLAKKELTEIIESNNQDLEQTVSFSYFLLGEIFFKRNNFAESIKYFDKFFKTTKTTDYLGIANLEASIAYRMLNDKANFRKSLQLCTLGNENIPEDAYASYISEHYLSNPFTRTDSLLQIAWNYYESGIPQKGLETIKKIEPSLKNNDNLCEAFTIKALCNFDLENYSESIVSSKKALKFKCALKPFYRTANLTLVAFSNYSLKDFASCKKFLKKAEESNDSFFTQKIEAKINWLKRKLACKKAR